MPQQDPAPQTHEEVLNRYRALRSRHQGESEKLTKRQGRLLLLLGVVAVVIALQTSFSLHGRHSPWPMLVSFAVAIFVIVLVVRLQSPIERTRRLLAFYDHSLARADGSEPYSALTGEDALETANHLYRRDLDITGEHSLFSLLATVRTGIGEGGLARYLLVQAGHAESVARQQAVRELAPQTHLREQIALLGASRFQQLSATFFDSWLDEPPPAFHPAIRYVLFTTTGISLLILLAGILQLRPWGAVLPNLAAVLALQTVIAGTIRRRVLPMFEGGAKLQGQIRLFAEGVDLLQRTPVAASHLLQLQRLSREPAGAVKLLKKLDGSLVIIEQRSKEYFFIFSLLTAAGCHAAISLANWKRRHAAAMRVWLTAWAEFEALNALATFAFEHPAYSWPELLPPDTSPTFEARTLGHPLLAKSVPNDIRLAPDNHFYLISGSNMAGKSTLMRSIGVAAVLAYAGAPVQAASLRLTPLTIGASIALVDSLAEGKSKFLTEVERLGAVVDASRTQAVLFLVDEIFSGTNSADRSTAAGAVLRRLLANGAVGALSTHDLALTTLATPENHGTNVHMASPNPADPLAFDYILKSGVNQHSNALAIIRLIGLDQP